MKVSWVTWYFKDKSFYHILEKRQIHCVSILGSLILYLQNTDFMT